MGGMVMVADPGSYGPLEKEALKILYDKITSANTYN